MKAVAIHILLRLFQIAACQVLLHHVLVETGHDNSDEYAADKLFEEILFGLPVIEYEYPAVLVGMNDP